VHGEWSLAPGSDASKVLLFFHGGGYCSGSIKSHRRMVTEAGRAMRMRTLAIDFRRAPEDPFPTQHEDALTAWRFLRRRDFQQDTSWSAATAPAAISRFR
jgi:epsilon-lactone hydrolase